MTSKQYRVSFLVAVACAALLPLSAGPSVARSSAFGNGSSTFTTPEQGFQAFEQAVQKNDVAALQTMLGPDSQDLLSSGDAVDDQNARERFLAAYQSKSRVTREGSDLAKLNIGEDNWEFPIPMERTARGWRFDTIEGREEIIDRRVGRNELNAIQACLAFVDAEHEYASADRDGDGVLEYAQRFLSTPGAHDGLYWPSTTTADESPLGEAFAQASAAGYQIASISSVAPTGAPATGNTVLYGYRYRILDGQGPAARGGAYDYVVRGKMIGGFAMVAYPANYGVSGVMTFIVNHDGQVYQKDLGPDTESIAKTMARFNPDRSWQRA